MTAGSIGIQCRLIPLLAKNFVDLGKEYDTSNMGTACR